MLITERLYVPDDVDAGVLFGVNRENLILLRTLYPKLRLVAGDNVLKILGEASQIDDFVKVLDHLSAHIRRYNSLNEDAIRRIARGEDASTPEPEYHIVYGARGKSIAARGANQQRMLRTFEEKDLLFAGGPAGTGKTFVAIALAVKALKERKIRRIILSRPAVEAGEKLGFLPGEMKDKLDPYLQPLYDALEEMIPPPRLKEYMEQGTIQIAPLAYMRGRTLNDAVVILDEAQNTTTHQILLQNDCNGRRNPNRPPPWRKVRTETCLGGALGHTRHRTHYLRKGRHCAAPPRTTNCRGLRCQS